MRPAISRCPRPGRRLHQPRRCALMAEVVTRRRDVASRVDDPEHPRSVARPGRVVSRSSGRASRDPLYENCLHALA